MLRTPTLPSREQSSDHAAGKADQPSISFSPRGRPVPTWRVARHYRCGSRGEDDVRGADEY
jgi:hypothetical protein